MALGVSVGLVATAVVAAYTGSDGGGPRPLPVLGEVGAGTGAEASMSADSSLSFGGITYRLDPGVAQPGDEATAWSLRLGDGVEGRVQELATALGLTGEVVSEEFAWTVTEGVRRLEVQRQPGLPWNYLPSGLGVTSSGGSSGTDTGATATSMAAEPAQAPDGDKATVDPDAPVSSSASIGCDMPECPAGMACAAVCPEVDPMPACDDPAATCLAPDELPEPERPADLPASSEAEAKARDLLAAAGLDLDGAAVRVDDGFTAWYVSVDPMVGGLPTIGMSSGVAIGAAGAIESANGWLGDPEQGDTYPLRPLAAAVERLSGMSMTLELRAPCPEGEACPEPEPVVLTVTGARLGLQLVSSFEASESFLVPSYLLEVDGGGRESETPSFAVADEYLTAAAPVPAEPVPLPEPLPPAEQPPSGGSAEPPAPVAPAPAPTCVAGTGVAGEAPLDVEVCAEGGSAGTVPVVLTVRATDADARVRNDCGSPVVSWGDGEPTAICDIGVGCAADEPATPLETSLEHIYAEAGNYEVEVTVESVCDDPASGALTVPILVVVTA